VDKFIERVKFKNNNLKKYNFLKFIMAEGKNSEYPFNLLFY